MKYATLMLGLAIVLASVAVATACEGQRVKPHQMGWACVFVEGTAEDATKLVRVKGGYKRKRDVVCP